MEYSSIVPIVRTFCSKWIIGKEIGESGTPHLQGFLKFHKKCRPMSVFKEFPKIHWEKCKGTVQDNYNYCSKEGDFECSGFPQPIKIIKPNRIWQQQILKIITEEPDDRTIYWFWSREGGVGKTAFCKYLTVNHNALPLHGKGADVRNGICDWFKNKGSTPELVVFPIPRSYNSDYLSYESIENIKDMYFYSGKYEGGVVCGNAPHLFIFSNQEPDYDKLSADRWRVYQIDG